MERSEVALWFTFVSSSILQQPSRQAHFSEVHVALVEPSHAIGLIVDVVCNFFQVLQVRPLEITQKYSQTDNNNNWKYVSPHILLNGSLQSLQLRKLQNINVTSFFFSLQFGCRLFVERSFWEKCDEKDSYFFLNNFFSCLKHEETDLISFVKNKFTQMLKHSLTTKV